jgi:hypothetical protein
MKENALSSHVFETDCIPTQMNQRFIHPSPTSSVRIGYKPGFPVCENQLRVSGKNITFFSQNFITSDLLENRTSASTYHQYRQGFCSLENDG